MKKLTLKHLDTLPYGAQESLNRLRVNLGFCGKEYKKIIVTSSTPGEGKSFVSVNLWRMLAEAGHKVVLVDADIRKSMMRSRHQIVGGEENYIGITFYLSGQDRQGPQPSAAGFRGGLTGQESQGVSEGIGRAHV